MIESVVLPSLSPDLITITELLMEESSPGLRYCRVGFSSSVASVDNNLIPFSRYGSKDWYEEMWVERWI